MNPIIVPNARRLKLSLTYLKKIRIEYMMTIIAGVLKETRPDVKRKQNKLNIRAEMMPYFPALYFLAIVR